MRFARRASPRWTLADLIDFEALLAREPAADAGRHDGADDDRLVFARDIRPQLTDIGEAGRRRAGLRLWLAHRRARTPLGIGRLWETGVALVRLGLFAAMALAGAGLVAGFVAAPGPRVHVVVFLVLALVLPWLLFLVLLGVGGLSGGRGPSKAGLLRAIAAVARRSGSAEVDEKTLDALSSRLADSAAARRALHARLAGVLQWGGLGFNLGLVVAFVAALLVFDVRFYWEATPETSGLMQASVTLIGAPWQRVWPAAVPSAAQIEASRARVGAGAGRVQLPARADATAVWWRFLLMSLLVWGVLPRVGLIALCRAIEGRSLARLDFQAPRHRRLWRALATVERGAVAAPVADGALVLDVGGAGLDTASLRGFLLRALRVNPRDIQRVLVLDDDAEARADAALRERPEHVVLFVEDWTLSPRQTQTLHQRARAALGTRTPVTWVVYARDGNALAAPAIASMQRWTAFVDGLRDPATEIARYDPGA